VEGIGAAHRRAALTSRRTGTAVAQQPRGAQRDLVDPAGRSAVGRSAGALATVPDLPLPLPTLGARGHAGARPRSARP
jgi:hypothetical protein